MRSRASRSLSGQMSSCGGVSLVLMPPVLACQTVARIAPSGPPVGHLCHAANGTFAAVAPGHSHAKADMRSPAYAARMVGHGNKRTISLSSDTMFCSDLDVSTSRKMANCSACAAHDAGDWWHREPRERGSVLILDHKHVPLPQEQPQCHQQPLA